MIILLKLAWRNIFRNKRRNFLAGLAIGIGLAALIFMDALIIGMKENMIKAATGFFPGQGQIHAEGFRKTFEVQNTIHNSDMVVKNLTDEKIIQSFTKRTAGFGMITSPSDVSSILLWGVDPLKEKKVSKIHTAIKQGKFLDELDSNKILLGKKLAKNLDVTLGDRIVITLAQAKSGRLSQEMFRVGGIFFFNMNEMDTSTAFIDISKMQEMLKLPKGIHEIAFNFKDIKMADSPKTGDFYKKYSKYGNEALGWNRLFSDLNSLLNLSQYSMGIGALILFGLVSFGIVNTLFMSLYERMFEFGVLRAIGTRPSKMAFIVIFEACSLALISIIIGILISLTVTFWLSKTGIDYRGLDWAGVTIQELIYPVLMPYQFFIYPLSLFILTALVGIYPALYAARLTPAKAMRKTF